MSESAAAEFEQVSLAFVRAIEFASISPEDGLLMGPGVAVPRLLQKVGLALEATGARIVTQLANEMARRDARYGLVSICGAGATAAALLLERD